MVINTGHICNQEEHSCDRAVNQGNSELWFGNQTRKPCHETWVCAPSECSSGASTFHMKRNHWWTLSLLFSLFISLPSTLQIELIIKASVSIVINRKKKQNKLDKISETNAKRKQQTSKTFTHRNHPAPQWLVSQSRVKNVTQPFMLHPPPIRWQDTAGTSQSWAAGQPFTPAANHSLMSGVKPCSLSVKLTFVQRPGTSKNQFVFFFLGRGE